MTSMIFAYAYGTWERPIDENIYGIGSTFRGELRIPFACHVRQSNATQSLMHFHQFNRLPAELKLRILQSCDKPTLFQLMHTSHFTRTEAKELFFSDSDTWYLVEGEWLETGGQPGDMLYDMDFLSCIQRLHIDFVRHMDDITWTSENIRQFWKVVQHCFPQVKHIMISDESEDCRWDTALSEAASWPPPEHFQQMCQLCPPHINVFISRLRPLGRLKRTLWQRGSSQGDYFEKNEWQQYQSHPGPSVLVPPRHFRGPVGTFQDIERIDNAFASQKFAIRVFRLAAIERHYFYEQYKAFECSAPGCKARFERPEEFTSHVIGNAGRHDLSQILPEPYHSLFLENEKRLDRLDKSRRKRGEDFANWWGDLGSEQRKAAEKEYECQLNTDPLYMQSKPVLEHKWRKAIQRLDYEY